MRWARETAGYSVEDAASKIRRPPHEIEAWEEGSVKPTMPQARRAAEVYRRPLAVFYLEEPPTTFQPLQDFRRLPDDSTRQYSPELAFLVRHTHYRQEWLHEYLVGEGTEPLDFVGSADLSASPQELAATIRTTLGISREDQHACRTKTEALGLWVRKTERAGVFVFREGAIECREGRGFVLSDACAPFIFLNSKDAKAAQIFTLAHELAHLWLGQSSISNLEEKGSLVSPRASKVEVFCNRVAADTVVEPRAFWELWREQGPGMSLESRIEDLSAYFRVSNEVVARRLLDAGVIYRDMYERLCEEYRERWQKFKEREAEARRRREGGPSYYLVRVVHNGVAFTQTVLGAYYGGAVSGRDTAGLLGVKLNHLDRLATEATVPRKGRGNNVA